MERLTIHLKKTLKDLTTSTLNLTSPLRVGHFFHETSLDSGERLMTSNKFQNQGLYLGFTLKECR